MQTDKELFDQMKETYPINPRKEFVLDTSIKLRQTAKKLKRKRRVKQFSFASIGIAVICAIASMFVFYDGRELILNNFSTLGEGMNPTPVNEQNPLIYIYHTHNLESFNSEAENADQAFHETNNITLIGEKLHQSLKEKGIPSIHDKTDIQGILDDKSLSFDDAYNISRGPLEEAVKRNKSIKMVFDIHRDATKKHDTTITINNKNYSRIALIVSRSSSNYEENLKFAELLHDKMEEKYPSLSKGVIINNHQPDQKTYNQDVIDNSVLLNIGGFENTLEEEYRTVDVLSEIIKEILHSEK